MLTFNTLLTQEGVDPRQVTLVRHQTGRDGVAAYWAWRDERGRFEEYQRIQRKKVFGRPLVASFVLAPQGETLFVGLYSATESSKVPEGTSDPLTGEAVGGMHYYHLDKDSRLAWCAGRLIIGWAKGRSWFRKADAHLEPVIELPREQVGEEQPDQRSNANHAALLCLPTQARVARAPAGRAGMKAYACVYLHPVLHRSARRHAEYEARKDDFVRRYLDSYGTSNSFYDWGDDPGFFAATEMFGSPDKASWGVCRPDVRAAMSRGDFVAFFCAKQEVGERNWNYFWIGLGTVGECLTRDTIWAINDYKPYRHFLNILARPVGGVLHQYEYVNVHEDWKRRAAAQYILFDPKGTRFNLSDPLHVASYKRARGDIEEWRWGDDRVRQIGELILPDPRSRGLRTTNPYRPHAKMNLDAQAGRAGGFKQLREELLALVDR